jgi:ketosteroid isomerase-like protein
MDTKLNGNGQPFHNSYAFVYRFEDGRIAEVWEYVDTERAHKLFEKAGIPEFVNTAG